LLRKGQGLPGGMNDAKRMALSGLQTLKSLNERGLIHRDIKPANTNFDARSGPINCPTRAWAPPATSTHK
jgi:serine/threonine protein kinase